MAHHDRSVYPRPDGRWANQRDGASRPATVHDTQKAAIDEARRMLTNAGGGELTIMGKDGTIRDKRTIPPARDPYPPKG